MISSKKIENESKKKKNWPLPVAIEKIFCDRKNFMVDSNWKILLIRKILIGLIGTPKLLGQKPLKKRLLRIPGKLPQKMLEINIL